MWKINNEILLSALILENHWVSKYKDRAIPNWIEINDWHYKYTEINHGKSHEHEIEIEMLFIRQSHQCIERTWNK